MTTGRWWIACLLLVNGSVLRAGNDTAMRQPLVRIAELEIDAAQLGAYKAALKEEITASIRVESGVLTLYAVSVKDRPAEIRLFEMYKDQAAYESHLESPHFKKYKRETQGMVRSLRLIETEPILLGAKAGLLDQVSSNETH